MGGGRRWWVAAALVVAACSESPAPTSADASATPAATARRDRCDGTRWSVPAYDAVYELTMPDGTPWIVAEDPRGLPDLDGARDRLAAAAAVDPARVPEAARLLLQHDVWGLAQRLRAGTSSEPRAESVAVAAQRLERTLALPAARLSGWTGRTVAEVTVLRPEVGWREVASEMPVLSHERAFGLRRIFRLAKRDSEVALFSQLVVRDTDGVAHQTTLTGEVERLTIVDDEVVAAHVHELDRDAVRCGKPAAMREVERVAHVPGRGADFFLGRFEDEPRVADLPCLQCHHDPHLGSLPNEALDPAWRWPSLLAQVSAS